MTPVFADTSYYLALFNRDDSWHAAAVGWSEHDARPVLLTEFVLVEVGSAFSRGRARGKFVELVRSLRSDPATTIVAATSDFFDRGLRLFSERGDKDWSLTDCI